MGPPHLVPDLRSDKPRVSAQSPGPGCSLGARMVGQGMCPVQGDSVQKALLIPLPGLNPQGPRLLWG